MAIEFISTDKAPEAVGPYSQAARVGNLLFLSGQIPIDPATQELKLFNGDVVPQTELVMSNIRDLLESQGLGMDSVVKTSIFLTSMGDFGKVNEVYANAFGDHRPARSCVEVSSLPKGVSVEIECIAVAK
jgi:2-iminobutanoate/2-iminopropanoate deaminase